MEIVISGQKYETEDPQTVKGIFILGGKPDGELDKYELYRIVGDQKDLLYSRTKKPKSTLNDKILLHAGEEFSIVPSSDGVGVTIYVQSSPKTWNNPKISYKEVVELAYGSYDSSTNIAYTILYFDGPTGNKEGSLVRGREAEVAEGMKFSVSRTDKS